MSDTADPETFLNEVVVPNIKEFSAATGSVRLAANAILSADAFFGILFARMKATGRSSPSAAPCPRDGDDAYRERLAADSNDYHLIRDTAAALKHGQLRERTTNPRLVKGAAAVQAQMPGVGGGGFMAGYSKLNEETVLLLYEEPPPTPTVKWEHPEFVLINTLKLARRELAYL